MEDVELIKNIGAMTFHNRSVIDYSIVSYHALKFVSMFCISEVDSLFSDGYSLLSTTIYFNQSSVPNTKSCPKQSYKGKPKLPDDKKSAFVENINHSKLNDLQNLIHEGSKNYTSVNREMINSICVKFSEMFCDSAQACDQTNHSQIIQKTENLGLADNVQLPVRDIILLKQNIQKPIFFYKVRSCTSK